MKLIKSLTIIASLAMVLALSINDTEAQNRNRNQNNRPNNNHTPAKVVHKVSPLSLLNGKQFSFTANRMVSGGMLGTKSVSGIKQMIVNKTVTTVNLPFYGKLNHANYGASSNPMHFDGKISQYRVQTKRNRNSDSYIVTYEVKPSRDNNRYYVTLEVSESGSAVVNINHNFGDSVTYYGNIDLI